MRREGTVEHDRREVVEAREGRWEREEARGSKGARANFELESLFPVNEKTHDATLASREFPKDYGE